MLPEKNFIRPLTLRENLDEHVDVVCYGRSTGVIEVYAYGGLPPYQYSIDGENWQSSGHFDNLAVPEDAISGKDQYGETCEGEITFYVKDVNNKTASKGFMLRSPAKLEFIPPQDEQYTQGGRLIFIEDTPYCGFATIDMTQHMPTVNTKAGNPTIQHTVFKDHYNVGITTVRYTASVRACRVNDVEEDLLTVFSHFLPNAIQDFDGNWYDAVILGNHVWLAGNLKTTHYADGEAIESDDMTIFDYTPSTVTPDYNSDNYGILYAHSAACRGVRSDDENVIIQGAAPNGWHICNDNEIYDILNFASNQEDWILGGNMNYIAKALSSDVYLREYSSTTPYCPNNNIAANNASKFDARYAGSATRSERTVSRGECFYMLSATSHDLESGGFHYLRLQLGIFNGGSNPDVTFSVGSEQLRGDNIIKTRSSVRCVSDLSPLEFCKWYYTQYGTINHQIS